MLFKLQNVIYAVYFIYARKVTILYKKVLYVTYFKLYLVVFSIELIFKNIFRSSFTMCWRWKIKHYHLFAWYYCLLVNCHKYLNSDLFIEISKNCLRNKRGKTVRMKRTNKLNTFVIIIHCIDADCVCGGVREYRWVCLVLFNLQKFLKQRFRTIPDVHYVNQVEEELFNS